MDLQEVDKLLTQTLSWCNGAKSELFGDGSVASKRDKCIKAICKAEDKIITARDIIRGRSGEFITESFEAVYQQSKLVENEIKSFGTQKRGGNNRWK